VIWFFVAQLKADSLFISQRDFRKNHRHSAVIFCFAAAKPQAGKPDRLHDRKAEIIRDEGHGIGSNTRCFMP